MMRTRPGGMGGKRPDRCVIVYSQRMREVLQEHVPSSSAASKRACGASRISIIGRSSVRRSVLVDAKADLLVYGNAERQIGEIARRLHDGASIGDITDLRGTAYLRRGMPAGWVEIDSSELDAPGPLNPPIDPYASEAERRNASAAATRLASSPRRRWHRSRAASEKVVKFYRKVPNAQRERSVIRMPSFEQVSEDPVLYAHASRILHLESNPGNARALVQRHGTQELWLNPPPIPAEHGGHGCHLRIAVRAPPASRVRRARRFRPIT